MATASDRIIDPRTVEIFEHPDTDEVSMFTKKIVEEIEEDEIIEESIVEDFWLIIFPS